MVAAAATPSAAANGGTSNGHHFADVEAGPARESKRGENFRYPTKVNFFKRLLFLDVDPLIYLGFRTRLEPEHLCHEPSVATATLMSKLEPAWQEQLKKEKPDLKRALLRGNLPDLILSGVLYIIAQACSLAGPLLLRRIVGGLQCHSVQDEVQSTNPSVVMDFGCDPYQKLYYYIIGLFLAPVLQSLCENQQMFMLYVVGTRMRNSLMAAIYRKCLRLSNSALQAESTGRVVTLMSNDAQKLQDAMMAIHAVWGSPCYIVAVLTLLWFEVGWATFVGLGVMLALVPTTGYLAAKLGLLRRELLKWTDQRVGRMSELINGIQMIKFYAWEPSFRAEVMKCRNQEARILRKTAAWQAVFAMLLFSGPILVAIFCFGSYTVAGMELTTAKAYTALALFSLLRFPMSFLPMLLTMIINALVAIKRISGFLLRDEAALPKWDKETTAVGTVRINDGYFTWGAPAPKPGTAGGPPVAGRAPSASKGKGGPPGGPPGANGKGNGKPGSGPAAGAEPEPEEEQAVEMNRPEIPTLRNINLSATSGSLTMVVGGVGSGKSSVLSALIGHMTRLAGEVAVGGRVAYAAQSAWIMNDTLQENVLCGSPMDPVRYQRTLQVSQLGADLDILPNGDLTEIGDRGITLSGGQKQRVSIARAVYADADVYFLDDPLSAVDSHVGKSLFDEVIRGVLRNKTVVLVTNALQYLPHADTILWLEDGAVKAQGTYQQLLDAGLNIAELAHDEAHDKDQEDASKEAAGVEGDVVDAGSPTAVEDGADGAAKEGAEAANGGVTSEHIGAKEAAKGAARNMKNYIAAGKITLTRQATDTNRNLTGIETRESGSISTHVVMVYVMAGGGVIIMAVLVFMFALEQGARVYTDTWVGNWFGDKYNQSTWFYLGIYAALGVLYSFFTFLRSINFTFTCVRATLNIHNQLLDHILALPKSFFDTNPAGRILNRFSRDVDIMDTTLPASLIQFAGCVATYISILVVITIATKWFGVALVPLTIIYFTIQRYYIPSARELQRIESVTRSPIYSRFGEALAGVATIRAYRFEAHFTELSDRLMEVNAYAFVTQRLASGWLAMRLDVLGLCVLTLAGALCIQGGIEPGMAGLALVYALDLTRFLKHGTAMASKSEADFNSVERIVQYLQPATEAAAETDPRVAKELGIDDSWPQHGAIEVQKLCMRYRPEMPLVLKGISFRVAAGEKVGLVGRTGSGKSSILLAMFRMVEAESGTILVDGVDVSRLGVRHLRSKMSIIPQDPFMFSGTVRHNLDPFATQTDDELWRVVDAVGLRAAIEALDDKLGAKVVDNGGNFSLGQRQLFCLARAMLRQSKILMLDEATASVDVDTDSAIQVAIQLQFGDVTCLTIAHRLHTIMESDRVVVLDQGRVVEDDEPVKLLEKSQGIFSSLVEQTGRSSSRYLHGLARDASLARIESATAGGPRKFVTRRQASVFGTTASFDARKQDMLHEVFGAGAESGHLGSSAALGSPAAGLRVGSAGFATTPSGRNASSIRLPAGSSARLPAIRDVDNAAGEHEGEGEAPVAGAKDGDGMASRNASVVQLAMPVRPYAGASATAPATGLESVVVDMADGASATSSDNNSGATAAVTPSVTPPPEVVISMSPRHDAAPEQRGNGAPGSP